jgi:sec-independent protein translocase protein TatC
MELSQYNFKFLNSDEMVILIDQMNEEDTEMFFNEHFEEMRQRFFQAFCLVTFLVCISFLYVRPITQLLQLPAGDIKFFQLAPGEYFVSTLKIALYTGLVFSLPVLSSQCLFFLVPGLSQKETKLTYYLLFSCVFLFIIGLLFSYFILIPAALQFFVNYNREIIEPFWSFDQYFSFIVVLFLSTGLVFQLPIAQIILQLTNIVSGQKMINAWKYTLLIATIIAAILTPSADPITQLLLTGAIFLLYMGGGFAAIIISESF